MARSHFKRTSPVVHIEVMSGDDLSDEQWKVIDPLLPPKTPGRGCPRADERKTLNGIIYVLKSSVDWGMIRNQGNSFEHSSKPKSPTK